MMSGLNCALSGGKKTRSDHVTMWTSDHVHMWTCGHVTMWTCGQVHVWLGIQRPPEDMRGACFKLEHVQAKGVLCECRGRNRPIEFRTPRRARFRGAVVCASAAVQPRHPVCGLRYSRIADQFLAYVTQPSAKRCFRTTNTFRAHAV